MDKLKTINFIVISNYIIGIFLIFILKDKWYFGLGLIIVTYFAVISQNLKFEIGKSLK